MTRNKLASILQYAVTERLPYGALFDDMPSEVREVIGYTDFYGLELDPYVRLLPEWRLRRLSKKVLLSAALWVLTQRKMQVAVGYVIQENRLTRGDPSENVAISAALRVVDLWTQEVLGGLIVEHVSASTKLGTGTVS